MFSDTHSFAVTRIVGYESLDAQRPERDTVYSVIATMEPDGGFTLEMPGFPAVAYRGDDMAEGIRYVKECLHEELLTSVVMPQVPEMEQVMLGVNQVLMQVRM